MANTYRNIPIQGLTDLLGTRSERCKTCSGKMILVSKSAFREADECTMADETPQDELRKATTYANFAWREEVYINKARDKSVTGYSLAITDWFVPPQVLLVSVDCWTGKPGQTIRVKARDNVGVVSVSVVIRDVKGSVLERGEAVLCKAGGAWWKYITTTRVPTSPAPRVEATARDLAGNENTFILC